MEPLRISRGETAGWIVLTLVGVVDVATAAQLRQALIEVQQGTNRSVALDLDGVEFMDSFGLGVIVGGLKRAAVRSGELVLVCSRSRLRQLLDLTRLTEIVRVEASLEEIGPATGTCE
jgi:anti-sigma B factor antagonist